MTNADLDAIYARVSSDKSEKQETIKTQLDKIKEQFGLENRPIYRKYLDEPYSGEHLERPALDELMRDADAGHFSRVLIYHPDRLSRGPSWHRPWLESQLRNAGVTVRYVAYEQKDTPEGEMMDELMSTFASYERKRMKQRTDDGRARKLREGHPWRSTPIYGWRYVRPTGTERHGHFEMQEEEAKVIREIFDLILSGTTAHAVTKILNERDVPTATGTRWFPSTVQHIIHNPIHSGRVAIGRYIGVEPSKPRKPYRNHRKSSSRERPREEWQFVQLPDFIVTADEQTQAEARLTNNKKKPKGHAKHPYLLAGLLHCGHDLAYEPGKPCGGNMYGMATTAGTRLYRCNRRPEWDRHMPACCHGRINADTIEDAVWKQVVKILNEPSVLLAAIAQSNATNGQRRNRLATELTRAHATHDSTKAKLAALTHKNLEGLVDDETYTIVRTQLVETRDNATEQIAHLENELAQTTQQQTRWDNLEAYCHAANARLEALMTATHAEAFAAKQAIIRELFTGIWVYDDHIRIEGFAPAITTEQPSTVMNTRRASRIDPRVSL